MGTYLYDFNGTDTADGSMPTPLEFPVLEQVSGSWRRLNNRAYTSTSHYSDPILAITDGTGDADVTVNVSTGGGDCVYARVADASNWIRLRFRRWQTSYTYTYYVTEYEWRYDYYSTEYRWVREEWKSGGDGPYHTTTSYGSWGSTSGVRDQGSYTHSHDGFTHLMTFDKYWESRQVYSGSSYSWSTSSPGAGWYQTGSSRQSPRTGTGYTTHYGLYLEQSVAGAITTMGSLEIGSAPTSLRLRVKGTSVEAFYNSGTSPVLTGIDNQASPYPRHGIGRGDSELSGQALDNFSYDSLNTPANPPTGLTPADGAQVSTGTDLVLSWVFTDPDPGDTQGAFDLEYRKVGDPAFTQVASQVQSSVAEYTLSAALLEPATAYEWRVRTYDQTLTQPGPWSAVTGFTTVAYGSVVESGQIKEVANMRVIVGGAAKPVTAVSVIVGGVKKAVG